MIDDHGNPIVTCVVCAKDFNGDTDQPGTWRDDCAKSGYTVCRGCHEGGAHEKWRAKAIAALRASTVAFPSEGNLAADYRVLVEYQRHDDRIKDGVCPNGCARMTGGGGQRECPVCHFTLNETTLHMPPE